MKDLGVTDLPLKSRAGLSVARVTVASVVREFTGEVGARGDGFEKQEAVSGTRSLDARRRCDV